MNKYLKIFLIILGTIISLIVLAIGIIFLSMSIGRRNKENEIKEHSKKCDSVLYIDEQPKINFCDFKKSEIKLLKFQILRNGKIINDTVLKNKSYEINIPYERFFKSDTIIVTTTNKLHYYISGYHHGAYCNWGMTGPVGNPICSFSDNPSINNFESGGRLNKIAGWINSEKSKKNKLILASSIDFDSLDKTLKITYDKANRIFDDNRKNVRSLQTIFGLEITPNGKYYIMSEELETNKRQENIVKINAETGEYKRYSNYPFDNENE